MLRLLHLSDIHFRGYAKTWDDDADQRGQLIADVQHLVAKDGHPVDGILVGGDIAWSGQPGQFEDAWVWLEELREASGCPKGSIWVVPGNHDVDRGVVDKSHILKEFHSTVRQCEPGKVDHLLRERIVEDAAAEALIAPLETYNEFASRLICKISTHELAWFDDRVLALDGAAVALSGLNSAFISDGDDCGGDQGAANLILGSYQARIAEKPGQVRIVLCHHPPTWLSDWERVEPYLARAHILLFGHEHTYNCHQETDRAQLRIHAGAVGPEREKGCAPSYNLITIERQDEDLAVTVRPRVWCHDKMFKAHDHEEEGFRIALDRRTLAEVEEPEDISAEAVEDEAPAATPLAPAPGPGEVADQARLREIAVAYMSAPITRRLQIATDLGVLDEEILKLPTDRERYAAILALVREAGRIDDLAKELNL